MTAPQSSAKVAARYATALLEAADEQGQLSAIEETLKRLGEVTREVPELTSFLSDRFIPVHEKQTLVDSQFKSNAPELWVRFLDLLSQSDRLALLPELIAAAENRIREKAGIATAYVTVPTELPDATARKLQKSLTSMFGYTQVDLQTTVDPSILAGAIVRIGDKIIDGSYRGKINMLKKQIG